MNLIKKILIPTDFSQSADNAIHYLLGLNTYERKIEFVLLNCISKGSELEESAQKLDNIKKEYFDKVHISCQTLIMKGELNACVSEVIKTSKIDMIAMGTSGQNDLYSPSKTASLVHDIDCPVWVIPNNIRDFQLKNMALAIDEKELDEPADLSVLHDIAKWYNTKIHLLKVDPEDLNRDKLNLRKEHTLAYYLDGIDYHYSFPKNSDIELGLKKYISENQIDALAILPRAHAKKSTPSKGELTNTLVSFCDYPLLVID